MTSTSPVSIASNSSSAAAGGSVIDVNSLVSQLVAATRAGQGYWIQEPNPDDDPRTSEGIYVYGGTIPPVGAMVRVTGTVSEYYPGGVPPSAASPSPS